MTRTPNWWDELPETTTGAPEKSEETHADLILRAGDALSLAVTLHERDPGADAAVGAAIAKALSQTRMIPAGDPAGIRLALNLLDRIDHESVEPPARSHLRRAEDALIRALKVP